jgi:hypothetical protein
MVRRLIAGGEWIGTFSSARGTRQVAVSRLRPSLGPIDCRRGVIIPAVVGLGKTNRAVFGGSRSPLRHMKAPTLSAGHRGTESSNPFPSSRESTNLRSLGVRLLAGSYLSVSNRNTTGLGSGSEDSKHVEGEQLVGIVTRRVWAVEETESGTRIHNGMIGRTRSDGGQGPDRARS